MKGVILSTRFTFILNNQDTLNNIDHLKMKDYNKFKDTNQIGISIQTCAKDNDCQQIQEILNSHSHLIPFLKLQIEDAFLSALNLKNYEVVKYFLENGFKINSVAEDALLTICYSLQYLKGQDIPIDLLKIALEYGANPRIASERDSETPMHLAAQYNSVPFLELLLEYGGDINGVNDNRETPLGLAIKQKSQAAISFLKTKGANQKWNS